MHTIDVAERRIRLARRHLLAAETRAGDVEEATSALVCLHATDPATVYLSARARVPGMSVADLDKALYVDRTLVKHLAMRRTLFVVPRATLPVVQAAASARVAETEARRLAGDVEKAGLHVDGARWLEEAATAVLAALSDGSELTSTELRARIPLLRGTIVYGEGKKWGGEVPIGPRVLTVLSARGLLVRGPNEGGWTVSRPRWAAMSSWLGGDHLEPVEERAARAELVRLWLHSFGGGTLQDVKWWLGSTLGAVRTALADAAAVEVDLHGTPGYVLPDDLAASQPVEPWAALLPALDPTTMGWFDRDWYLGAHRGQLFDTNGNGGPTAWWDGRIVGGWHQDATGAVRVDLLENVSRQARRALEAEAARLTAWLAGTKVSARFPSPLLKSVTRR